MQEPKETLVVMVNQNEILVQGRRILDLSQPLPNGNLIPALQQELQLRAEHAKTNTLEPFSGNITIMGDKEIPYDLLKRVMATCAQSEYPRVSLAVLQKAEAKDGGQTL
jgi:biopolymer transport protein ExbD